MFRDTDRGAKDLLKAALRAANGPTLRVGILDESQPANGGNGLTVGDVATDESQPDNGGNGLTVGDVATFHEFGTATIPERSFIRAWYDEQLTANKELFRKLEAQVIRGKITQVQMFEQMGLRFQASIQKRMSDGIAPELDPATIRAKGSSTPLIDTGQLRSSITYEVG